MPKPNRLARRPSERRPPGSFQGSGCGLAERRREVRRESLLAGLLKTQTFQVLAKGRSKIRPVQCKLYGRFQKAEFVTGVVALTLELQAVNWTISQHQLQTVG